MCTHFSKSFYIFVLKYFSNLKFILYAWHILPCPQSESSFACGQCPPRMDASDLIAVPAVTKPICVLRKGPLKTRFADSLCRLGLKVTHMAQTPSLISPNFLIWGTYLLS